MTADMPDLGPAARRTANPLDGVTEDQLTAPTPCSRGRSGGSASVT